MKRIIVSLLGIIVLVMMALPAASGVALAADSLSVDKTADSVGCRTYEVTLTITPTVTPPPSKPVDLILVIDRSGSMTEGSPTMLSYVQDATIDFAQQILENANNRVGVVSYSNSASLDQALTNDLTDVENAINGLTAREHQYTNIAAGFNTAANHMSSAGRDPATTARAIVLMSDGVANRRVGGSCTTWPTSPTTCTQAAITAGVAAQSQAMVFTVGLFGNLQASHPGCVPVARATLQQAQNGGYWETFEAVDVGPIYLYSSLDISLPFKKWISWNSPRV